MSTIMSPEEVAEFQLSKKRLGEPLRSVIKQDMAQAIKFDRVQRDGLLNEKMLNRLRAALHTVSRRAYLEGATESEPGSSDADLVRRRNETQAAVDAFEDVLFELQTGTRSTAP